MWLRTLLGRKKNARSLTPLQRRDSRSPRSRLLHVEPLEQRNLLAVFTNLGAAITIPDAAPAVPYPSTITVALPAVTAEVVDVNVALNDLTHTFPDDIDVLLVGPTGANAIIMSDVGGGTDVAAIDLTLDDEAGSPLPDAGPLTSGTFLPTNSGAGDVFDAPAPAPSGATALSTFDTTDPEGIWSLYVVDDLALDSGAFGGGWELNIQLGGSVTVDAGAAAGNTFADTFEVRLVGANLQVEVNGFLVFDEPAAGVTDLTIDGSTDDDTLIVDNGGGTVNVPILYTADGGFDSLEITGTPAGGFGPAARETYIVANAQGAGGWVIDPDGNMGEGAGGMANGDEMLVRFAGLDPVSTDSVVPIFDVVYDPGDTDRITIENGGLLNGFDSIQVTDEAGTFETFRFANKATVRLHLNDGADSAVVDFTTNATGLSNLEVYGNGAGGVAGVVADDSASDYFQLRATATGASTELFGQGGNDLFENLGFGATSISGLIPGGTFNLSALNGAVDIDGGSDSGGIGDYVLLSDVLSGVADAATLASTTLTGAAPTTLTYGTIENFYLQLTAFGDTLDVTSTASGTAYTLGGDSGSDTFTIGGPTAGFSINPNGSLSSGGGSLDAILGPIAILPDSANGPLGGDDIINVDDSGTGSLFAAASITDTGAGAISFPFATSITGDFTTLSGFAPATISYIHSDFGGVLGGTGNRLEQLNVFTSRRADTIAVNDTTAVGTTRVDMHTGNDFTTMTIAGDGLSAANIFHGSAGNDQFVLNVITHLGSTAFVPITSLEIWGDGNAGATAAPADNRDRLIINDMNAAFARNLNWDYADVGGLVPAGSLDIVANIAGAGLAGPVNAGMPVNVRSMETVRFNSTGTNDIARVTGTSLDDDLTVALRPNDSSAFVFIGGDPYLEAPPVDLTTTIHDLPGVAGGGAGPDLLINGINNAGAVPTRGITLDGDGTSGPGNRAIVYATSELDIVTGGAADIWGAGFAAGELIPGFGAGSAYDRIDVTDSLVRTMNNSAGALVPVRLVTASFDQTTPPAPAERAALIVNAGDEAVPQPNNIADDITATLSPVFNIQVNGNLPGLTFAPPGDKFSERQGDQLTIVSVGGALNVFSDDATPPNVSVTSTATGVFGIRNSSIERLTLDAGPNGIVNIIGDNNDPGATQNDYFRIRGRDVDGTGEGVNELQLEIGGNWTPATGAVDLSAPIYINNVTRLNVSGGEATGFDAFGNAIPETTGTGTDALDITPYADNTPQGWGVETYFNEGDDVGDGGTAAPDLLIYNGVLGVSENIVVQPSALLAGQVFANNAATGTPIAVVNYVLNTNIIVNGSSPAGAAGDTDNLFLRGTDPANPGTSGNEDVIADFTAIGDATHPLVKFYDAGSPPPAVRPTAAEVADTGGAYGSVPSIMYALQTFSNFDTINFELLGGDDVIAVVGRNDGSLTVNVDGGNPADSDTVAVDVTTGVDSYTVNPGASSDAGQILALDSNSTAATTINFVNTEAVNIRAIGLAAGSGQGGADLLVVNGTGGDDAITLNGRATVAGTARVNDGPIIGFNDFGLRGSDLELNGLGGDDAFSVAHFADWGFNDIRIDGGPPAASDSLSLLGADNVADTIDYLASSNNDATIDVTNAGTVHYIASNIESVSVDAQEGAADPTDVLNALNSPVSVTPMGAEAGTVQPFDAADRPLLPLSYQHVEDANATGGAVAIQGTAGNDRITVRASGVVELVDELGNVSTFDASAANALVLNVLGGDDTIVIEPSALFTRGISVIGGDNGDGSDLLVVASAGPTVDLTTQEVSGVVGGPVFFAGVENLTVNGADGVADAFTVIGYGEPTGLENLTLNGGDTNNNDGDTIDLSLSLTAYPLVMMPTSASTATLMRGPADPTVAIVGFNSAPSSLTVAGTAGADEIQVVTDGLADFITVEQTALGLVSVVRNVGADIYVRIDFPQTGGTAIDALRVLSGAGDDILDVDNTFGLVTLASGIFFDGGPGSDAVQVRDNAAGDDTTYTVGPAADAGTIIHTRAAATEQIFFTGVEPVWLVGGGVGSVLTVNATHASNAINYTAGPGAAAIFAAVASTGLVSVDGFETTEFAQYQTLVINALAGDDVINLNNPTTPTGLTGVTVNGGDPTASDTVIVNGTPDASPAAGIQPDAITVRPTGADSADVTVNGFLTQVFTIELLVVNGQAGGDALTLDTFNIDGTQVLTPGTAFDSGRVDFHDNSLSDFVAPSIEFLGLGTSGSLTFSDVGRFDNLIYFGTGIDDNFSVNSAGTVVLNSRVPVLTPSIITLTLAGLDGDDTFNIDGDHNLPSIAVEGGNPSASDVLNFAGSGVGDVTVDFAASTVTETGFGSVAFSGVETLNVNVGNEDIFVLGTVNDDHFEVTPDVTVATTRLVYNNTTVNANNIDVFTINGISGDDMLQVNATADNNVVDVTGAYVDITTPNRQRIDYVNFDALSVIGSAGDDTFNVTPAVGVSIFIDGGDPIAQSDVIVLAATPGVMFAAGPENDEGSFAFTAEETVSYDHIEAITVDLTNAGGTAIIMGTGYDDEITAVGVAANTVDVQVNDGPIVTYTNATALTLQGKNGDDDIVIDGDGATGVTFNVDGGLPPSGSDTLKINGTAGSDDSYLYTPTGQGSGTVVNPPGGPPAQPTVNFVNIEHLEVYGQSADEDVFRITGTTGDDTFAVTPSAATPDTFTVTGFRAGPGGFNFVPVVYSGMRSFTAVPTNFGPVGGSDTLIVNGTEADDVFSYADSPAFPTFPEIIVNGSTPIFFGSAAGKVDTVILRGLAGNDTFNLTNESTFDVDFADVVLRVEGGDSDAGTDTLNLKGDEGVVEAVVIAPDADNSHEQDVTGLIGTQIDVSGTEVITYEGGPNRQSKQDSLDVDLGLGVADARVANGALANADLVTSESLPNIEFRHVDTFTLLSAYEQTVATFVTNELEGADNYFFDGQREFGLVPLPTAATLVIEGSDGQNDSLLVTNPGGGPAGDVAVFDPSGVGVTVTALEFLTNDRLQINTLGGDDLITVNVDAVTPSDVIGVPMTVDGGLGRDDLVVFGSPATAVDEVIYEVGPQVDRGRLSYETGGAVLMQIDFVGLEPVHDYIPANLTVFGNHADNAINYTLGPNSGPLAAGPLNPGGVETGQISVDAYETIEFGNKVDLTIDGRAGDDNVNASAPGTPGVSGEVTLAGDDPTASDAVILNGTVLSDTVTIEITGPHSAIVTINAAITNVNTTENFTFNGLGGDDDVTILGITTGDNHFVYTPGAVPDAASFTGFDSDSGVPFLPVNLLELGAAGAITVDGNSAFDTLLTVQGTAGNDTVDIDGPSGDVTLTALAGVYNTLSTVDIDNLVVESFDGDDTFNVDGNHPYAGVAIHAGSPSASDVLNFAGSGGNVTVNFATSTVAEAGPVFFSGVETLNVNVGNADLFILGTVNDDHFEVTPDVIVATTRLVYNNTTVNANNIDEFIINGISGDDSLQVNATAAGNVVDVTGTFVDITTPNRQRIDYVNFDALSVIGSAGDDTFNVTPSLVTSIFIDGGDPIAQSDVINLTAAPGVMFAPGPESDEGSFAFTAEETVSFDHIEAITVDLSGAGGAAVIMGTGYDDEITAIGTAPNTVDVQVNDGPIVTYTNATALTLQGKNGDDDITVDINVAGLGVTFYVDGGLPTAGGDQLRVTGVDGDAPDTVIWDPSGADSGTLTVAGQTINVTTTEKLTYDGESDRRIWKCR